VNLAEFDRVVTHGDGAVGIQISQPIGRLVVHRGIETFGGTGDSLVKGVVMKLSAIALSIKPGGSAREIEIAGGVKTNGAGIAPIEQDGAIETLRLSGGFAAKGAASIKSEFTQPVGKERLKWRMLVSSSSPSASIKLRTHEAAAVVANFL
jgi:hypothetical protein